MDIKKYFQQLISEGRILTYPKEIEAIQRMIDNGQILTRPANNEPLNFGIGALVVYTNDYGVKFDMVIAGFCPEDHSLYQYGHRYFLCKDSYWFPVKASSCTCRNE